MESGHVTETTNGLKEPSAAASDENDHCSTRDNKLSHPSSKSSSLSDDCFELDANNVNTSSPGDIASSEQVKDTQLVSVRSEDNILARSTSNHEQHLGRTHSFSSSNNKVATASPPLQVMERPGDSSSSAAYRIPSSVFASTTTGAPVDWSVASNESLFSIHMGNMSFTREQLSWMGKSGDLCQFDPNMTTGYSGPLIEASSDKSQSKKLLPSSSSPGNKSTEIAHAKDKSNEHHNITESGASDTVRQGLRENHDDDRQMPLSKDPRNSYSLPRGSDASATSAKSFAFPILAGDDRSVSINQQPQPQRSSSPQTPKVAGNPGSRPQPEATRAATQSATQGNKWFACFSCCSFCR